MKCFVQQCANKTHLADVVDELEQLTANLILAALKFLGSYIICALFINVIENI